MPKGKMARADEDDDDNVGVLPPPAGYVPHGPPCMDEPSQLPTAIGRKEGPHISGEGLTEIINHLANIHGDINYSVRARVLTTHGAIKHLWGGINYTIGDEREVHLILLSGNFTFRRWRRVSETDNMQLEIDAVDGDVVMLGHVSTFKPYYEDPSLLDGFVSQAFQ